MKYTQTNLKKKCSFLERRWEYTTSMMKFCLRSVDAEHKHTFSKTHKHKKKGYENSPTKNKMQTHNNLLRETQKSDRIYLMSKKEANGLM